MNDAQAFDDHIDYTRIPERMRTGVKRYVRRGRPPGSFLRAVFDDSLSRAFGQADAENRAMMHEWVRFVYNELPGACWGSPERVDAWIEQGGLKGLEYE